MKLKDIINELVNKEQAEALAKRGIQKIESEAEKLGFEVENSFNPKDLIYVTTGDIPPGVTMPKQGIDDSIYVSHKGSDYNFILTVTPIADIKNENVTFQISIDTKHTSIPSRLKSYFDDSKRIGSYDVYSGDIETIIKTLKEIEKWGKAYSRGLFT